MCSAGAGSSVVILFLLLDRSSLDVTEHELDLGSPSSLVDLGDPPSLVDLCDPPSSLVDLGDTDYVQH